MSGAMMVTLDWRIEPGTMMGRHIIGPIELSSAMRSTSPRSSQRKRLFAGYLLHLSASVSPGSSGAAAAPPAVAPLAPVGGVGVGVAAAGGGGSEPGGTEPGRVPVGGPAPRCAEAGAAKAASDDKIT